MIQKRNAFLTQVLSFSTFLTLLFSACVPSSNNLLTPTPTGQAVRRGQLTPYTSPTPYITAQPPDPVAPTAAPSPTPTPRTHTVEKGEDMGAIAWMYQVTVTDLMAANPDVMPNLMSVGTVLIIPPSQTGQTSQESPSEPGLATPTAIPVEVGKTTCYPSQDGGVWCFLPVSNHQSTMLESLTAVIHLSGGQPEPILSRQAFALLDTLSPGAALPLAAYFPPEETSGLVPPYAARSEIQGALPYADNGRYLTVHLDDQKILLAENGLAAEVSLSAALGLQGGSAQRLWIAAVAYDAQGNVVGVRRWENEADRPLNGGQPMQISFRIYSLAGMIERVEVFAEARP